MIVLSVSKNAPLRYAIPYPLLLRPFFVRDQSRQADGEGASHVKYAGHGNDAQMPLYNTLRYGEPQPRGTVMAAGIRRVIFHKNFIHIFLRDPLPLSATATLARSPLNVSVMQTLPPSGV